MFAAIAPPVDKNTVGRVDGYALFSAVCAQDATAPRFAAYGGIETTHIETSAVSAAFAVLCEAVIVALFPCTRGGDAKV